MFSGCIKTSIIILSIVLTSSLFVQVSYSQGNGTLGTGGEVNIDARPSIGTSNNTEATITPDSEYEAAREQFLKIWDTLQFHPIVATFVNESAKLGNGVYQEHSNVFNPTEIISLYVQPVGFGHKQIMEQNGEKLYLINFTTDIILTTRNGTIIGGGQNIPSGPILSHYPNLETYLHLFLTHEKPLPKGDYKINYSVTDEVSGKTFKISKDVKVV